MTRQEFEKELKELDPDEEEMTWVREALELANEPDAPRSPFTYESILQGVQEMRY